jgi:hypothetical protein
VLYQILRARFALFICSLQVGRTYLTLFIHFVAGSRRKSRIKISDSLMTSWKRYPGIEMPLAALGKARTGDVIFYILVHNGVVFVVC